MSKSKGILFGLLLLTLSIVTGLFIGEFCYRFYLKARYEKQVSRWDHPLLKIEPNSMIEYSMRPNTQRENRISIGQGDTWIYTINSDGFRGRDISRKKNSNVKRILFLGDSYTFGWGINDNETYPKQLEAILNNGNHNMVVESVNLGVPGYNTVQEYGVLIKKPGLYKPNMVVLGYVMNDAEPQWSVVEDPKKRYKYAKIWVLETIKAHLNDWFFPNDSFFTFYIHRHRSKYLDGFHPDSPKWKESRDALQKIAFFCKSHKLPLLVIIMPDFNRNFDSSYPYTPIHEQVSRWCYELNADVIDLFPYFMGDDHEVYRVKGDGHPNAKAHKEIAELLSTPVEKILFSQTMGVVK